MNKQRLFKYAFLVFAAYVIIKTLYDLYIPTNPPEQYQTSVVYRGKVDYEVQIKGTYYETSQRILQDYLRDTWLGTYFISEKDGFYELDIRRREIKESALKLLQEGIDLGKIHVDENHYLVKE